MSGQPDWTAILSTRNRSAELLLTLRRLSALPEAARGEVVVVDNGSDDGTAAAVRGLVGELVGELARGLGREGREGASDRLRLRVIARDDANPCAGRNEAAAVAEGRTLVFLDDDSVPRPGAVAAAVRALEADPRLGAVGGPAFLPGGGQDACALPSLSACCGWAVRAEAFAAVGGFEEWLFMQAEELGFACRLLAAGWSVGRSEAVCFDHRKSERARQPLRTCRLDLRNNVFLAERFLPPAAAAAARPALLERYGRLFGRAGGSARDAAAAVAEADARAARAREGGGGALSASAAESLWGFERQKRAVAAFAEEVGLRPGAPVALAGFTKHADLTAQAAAAAGLEVVAVLDRAEVFHGCRLGGAEVVAPGHPIGRAALAVFHTDLNPGRPRPGADAGGRPALFLRDAYPRVARGRVAGQVDVV